MTTLHVVSFATDAAIKHSTELWKVREAAFAIRMTILSSEDDTWKFRGDFNNFNVPIELRSFLKWLTFGNVKGELTEFKVKETSRSVDIISQQIVSRLKSDRSVKSSRIEDREISKRKEKKFYQSETPLSVGLGLSVYSKTRSKALIEELSDLNISTNYKKTKVIEAAILDYVLEHSIDNNGVYVPETLSSEVRPFYAVDNCDFARDSKDGKGQLHGTIITAFQHQLEDKELTIVLKRTKDERGTAGEKHKLKIPTETCNKPALISPPLEDYRGTVYLQEEAFGDSDLVWALSQFYGNVDKLIFPIWKAYNSKLTDKADVTTAALLPRLKTPPTDWTTLYSALKIVQGISIKISPDKKSVVTLDLQLYIKCIQLSSRKDIADNFVFRMGELHIVFAMLRAIGSYIENSGLDKLFSHCGIFGPLAAEKILDGKHLNRCTSAFLILYSSIFNILLQHFLENDAELKLKVDDIANLAIERVTDNPAHFQIGHATLTDQLKSVAFFKSFTAFRNRLKKQGKYLSNILDMIGTMLLFMRATKQKLWSLHLASLDRFSPYFFALDLGNYARMTPVYLSSMYSLRKDDRETWDFISSNFCCNKTKAPFVAIGVDHCLEQVNKELKVMGGIVGLSDDSIDKYCLTVPIKRFILSKFEESISLTKLSPADHIHHEDRGSHRKFHSDGVKVYTKELQGFIDSDLTTAQTVFNVMTHYVLKPDEEVLKIYDIGSHLRNNFITERKTGVEPELSVWDTLPRRKLITFKRKSKHINVKVADRIVKLQEERGLMKKLVVISRTRTELDVAELFTKHEFSVVPRSLFDPQGKLWRCNDKSDFFSGLIEKPSTPDFPKKQDYVVIDGMGFVNQLRITSDINTLDNLAIQFAKRIRVETSPYDGVVLVFDRYDDSVQNLKKQTWEVRHQNRVQYNLSGNTIIKNIKLKELLSHPENKKRMCEVFGKRVQAELKVSGKRFVLIYGTTIESNVSGWTDVAHDHQEADTLLVCVINRLSQLQVVSAVATFLQRGEHPAEPLTFRLISPDTDVFMLAIHLLSSLPGIDIIFEQLTSKARKMVSIRRLVDKLGESVSRSLLGVYLYTGCDYTGRFNTITKARALNTFLNMKDDSAVTSGFSDFGESPQISADVNATLSKYTIQLYLKRQEDKVRYADLEDIGKLRWKLYTKHENDMLPPTEAALRFHKLRANYVTMMFKNSTVSFTPTLPLVTDCGWNIEDGILVPIMTDMLPAPAVAIDLVTCKCKKSCMNKRCACLKNGFKCTDACNCVDCHNQDDRFGSVSSDDDIDDV